MTGNKSRKILESRLNLRRLISHVVTSDGTIEPMPGLFLYRSSKVRDPLHGVSEPSLCIIAQGAKEVLIGDTVYRYNPEKYLISTVALPITGRIIKASRANPYLSLRLKLDPVIVSSVIIEASLEPVRSEGDAKAINVSLLDVDIMDAAVRLLRLVNSPKDARIIAPLIIREIIYRLLRGEQGVRLRHLASVGGHVHRMARAVEKLTKEFNKPLRIEGIAKELGMSPSGFHLHFKAVTAMTPIQFQKQIRLQEARRIMLSENLDASNAGFRVGYENAAHFSREYKRHFGEPPMRDVEKLRSSDDNR